MILPTIDWSIQFSDLLLFGGGVWAFLKIFIGMRDSLRDITRLLGTSNPPEGVLGDVFNLKRESQRHRTWLIEIGSELGVKRDDRT